MTDFLKIAITSPDQFVGEPDRIMAILRDGEADIVHIRKPSWNEEKTGDFIRKIDPEFHNCLKIHDHFSLIKDFDLRGINLNSRNPGLPDFLIHGNFKPQISRSLHSLEELKKLEETGELDQFEYLFLSPIYDSISKKGYKGNFDLNEISSYISDKRIIALGGVTPSKIPQLKKAGFYGAAMCGYFFPTKN